LSNLPRHCCGSSAGPTLLCHRLIVNEDRIIDYQLRVPEQKQRAVAAFKLLNYQVIAGGDSFNDTRDAYRSSCRLFYFGRRANVRQQFLRNSSRSRNMPIS